MAKVRLSEMPTIKVTFVVDQDQLGAVLMAMRPYARGPATLDDIGELEFGDIGSGISIRRAAALFRGERPLGQEPVKPERRKVRKTARRLRVKPNRPSKENATPVRGALVALVKKAGPSGIDPKALHDAMVGEGFGLQSSYNALFEAKRKKEVKLQNGNLVAL